MKNRWLVLLAAVLLLSIHVSFFGTVYASDGDKRYIAIVYDDSSSMRFDVKKRDVYKNYLYANYALQNFIAMTGEKDLCEVFLISKGGKGSFAVHKQSNLKQALKKATTVSKGGSTYAPTIETALRRGADWLKHNPDGQFMFVLVTDGGTMFDAKGSQITGDLSPVYQGYLTGSGLSKENVRCRALLFSIGGATPLKPVVSLQAALTGAGIPTRVFNADISDDAKAGENIISSMGQLAQSMAETSQLTIAADGTFMTAYPLTSLLLMEQIGPGRKLGIKSIIAPDGTKLVLKKLYNTADLRGEGLASAFYSVRAPLGDILPGTYTIEGSAGANLTAFPMVNLSVALRIKSSDGAEMASYAAGKWSHPAITLEPGETCKGTVSFLSSAGQAFAVGLNVRLKFEDSAACTFSQDGPGQFTITAGQGGDGQLILNLVEQGNFQIAVPPLAVHVPKPAGTQLETKSPSSSASPLSSQSPAPSAAELPRLEDGDLQALTATVVNIPFSSSREYRKQAEFTLTAGTLGELKAAFVKPLPPGLQLRFNDQTIEPGTTGCTLAVGTSNTVSVWTNGGYSSSDPSIKLQLENGQEALFSLQAVPRKLKLEIEPQTLEFSILQRKDSIPAVHWRLLVEEGGQWVETATASLKSFRVDVPARFMSEVDPKGQSFRVYPNVIEALTPTGRFSAVLSADTGKPGEAVQAEVLMTVQDSWSKWIAPGSCAAALLILLGYVLLLVRKPRISCNIEVWRSADPTMKDAERLPLGRNNLKRNFWPFGREMVTVGVLEISAHPKERKLVILSSTCVQYGLRIDSKAPQYYKTRDKAGDYIIGGNNIVTVREGEFLVHYRIAHNGLKEGR